MDTTTPTTIAQKIYFTSNHLARYFIGSAGTFTLFLITAALLCPFVADKVSAYSKLLMAATTWTTSLFLIAIYVVLSYTIGFLALRFYYVFRSTVQRIPWLGKFVIMLRYDGWYEACSAAINAMYEKHMSGLPDLSTRKSLDLNHKVEYLVFYLKMHNPEAYDHVCHEYTLVAMIRQALIYTLALLVFCLVDANWVASTVLGVFFVALLPALFYAVKNAVLQEFIHLMATTQWMKSRPPRARGPTLVTQMVREDVKGVTLRSNLTVTPEEEVR